MPGFNFGTGGGGFSFSTLASSAPTSSTPATNQFSFAPPATTSTGTTPANTASGSFSFTGPSNPGTAAIPATITPVPTSTTGTSNFSFNFNNPTTTPATPATPASGFSLFNLSTGTNTNTINTGPKLTTGTTAVGGSTPTTASFNFGLTSGASSTALTGATTSASLFGPPSTLPATSTVLPMPKDGSAVGIVAPTSSATLTVSTTSAPPSLFGTSASLTTATTTTSLSTPGGPGVSTSFSMRPLEERVNKWLVELKEQEERFVRQAAHVNAWDQILQNGHDQVQALKDTLHTVKSDQSRLEAEIDFIRGQQEELERLLEPLESSTASNPATQLHQGDRQRDNMYYLAQSLDAQLRQMTDDLGKVIEHLNTNAKPWQPNDPVALVARILSAHMDTLKWVDQNTVLLSQKMEEVARVASSAGKRG